MSAAVGMMNLLELREHRPDQFYPQTWMVREAFMRALPSDPLPPRIRRVTRLGNIPKSSSGLPSAVDLAHLFLLWPDDPAFQHYLWCSDVDSKGQRIFVGGVTEENGRKFEIHRHLAITMQWGVPSFT